MAEKKAKPSSGLSRPSAKADTGKATRKSTTGPKAVITSGGHQYLVSEGDELEVEKLNGDNPSSGQSSLDFEALLIIDGENISLGQPAVDGVRVSAEIVEAEVKADKVVAIRYKAKKRVHKRRGHRQKLTKIRITKISLSLL